VAAFAAVSWAQAATHQGVPAEDLVTLELRNDVKGGCGEAKLDFVRLFPDGTSDAGVFRVPEGRVLIVTDVDWHYFNGPPGLVVVLSVLIENLADPTTRRRAFESAVRLGPDGVGGASEPMTTGFAVAPEARLCLDVVNGSIGSPLRLSKVLLRGYLVDAAN
jgi:hypothetical protein